MDTIRILLIGGDEAGFDALKRLLEPSPCVKYLLTQEPDPEKAETALGANSSDVVFLWEEIGGRKGLDVARTALKRGLTDKPVILVMQAWQEASAQAAIELGCADCIALDCADKRLLDFSVRAAFVRVHSRELLAHERDLLQTLMDSIPDTIYFKDRESRFTRINKAQVSVLGVHDGADAIGKTDFDFFEHASEAYADEQRIMQTGQPLIDKQEKIHRADGEYRFVSTTKVPIKNKEGVITGTVGITRDITARVKAEKELEDVKVRLEQTMAGINEELEMARQIQLSLLPAGFPEMTGVKASSAYLPCSTIGGDFYEVIKIDERRLGVLMFDVVGHGVPAALVAAVAKMIFIENIAKGLSPSRLLSFANEKLFAHFQGKRHVAVFYGIIETDSGRFVFAKGGHPPAIVVRSAEKRTETLSTEGIFIGLFPDSTFEEKEITLAKNDRLVMFTDGIIETFNAKGQCWGIKKLETALLEIIDYPVDVMVSALINMQKKFRENTPPTDDVTLLVLQRL